MGKIKRERQKYHLSRAKSMNDLTAIEPRVSTPPDDDELDRSLPQVTVTANLFAGLEIPVDVNRPLPDDARSMVSTKSSFKDRNLTKKQKRDLRHDAFMRKLDVVHQTRREATARRRRQKTPVVGDMRTLADALPSLDVSKRPQVAGGGRMGEKKKKCLQKANVRQAQTLRDIDTYLKVVNDPAYQADPSTAITNYIQEKIRRELCE